MPGQPKQAQPSRAKQPKQPKQVKPVQTADEKKSEKDAKDAAFKTWIERMDPLSAPIFHMTTEQVVADDAKAFFDINGFVICYPFDGEPHVQAYCERVLPQMVHATMEGCHYKKELRDTVPLFDSKKQLDDLMGRWKGSETFKGMHKDLRETWYPHCTFGAPASNAAFDFPALREARGWDCLSKFADAIFGEKAYPTIDRPIAKPEGKGEKCFLHLDMEAPWFAKGAPEFKQVLGKLALSHGQKFLAVPGSHLKHEEVARRYKEFYPHASAKDAKWALDPRKGDPLDLFPGTKKIEVPRGCIIFWHPKLFHGVKPNDDPAGRVAFGFYLGFTNNIERAEYERVTGVDEVQDRYNTWRWGVGPKAFPSADLVHFLPHSFQNFPAGMLSYIRKCDPDDPGLRFYDRPLVKDSSRTARTVEEVRNPQHSPPWLSTRRKELLVGRGNVDKFSWGDDGGSGGGFRTTKRQRTK